MRPALGFGPILALAFVLSFCSLVYEMAIAACFVAFTGESPLWQSLTIGIYLASIGAGTWACSRRSDHDSWERLWRVELALAAAGAVSVLGVTAIDTAWRAYREFYDARPAGLAERFAVLGAGHVFTALIGFLSGFELPLLLRAAQAARAPAGRRVSRVLGMNYLGAIAGGLAFSFWLMPAFEPAGAAAIAAALNLGACAYLVAAGAEPATRSRLAALGAGAIWIGATAWVSPAAAELNAVTHHARRVGVPGLLPEEYCCGTEARALRVLRDLWSHRRRVERVPSLYQRIELVSHPFADAPLRAHFNRRPSAEPMLPYGLALFLDRRYQFYGGGEAMYHEFLAHVPVQLFSNVPRDVLILGGGDGLLAKELLKYGGRVRSITNVELDPAVVDVAKTRRVALLNRDAFRNPKVRVVIDDAFDFIRRDQQLYDAIYIDFPYPYTYDAARLYTVEFFRNVARRLRPGGFGAVDFPLVSEREHRDEPEPLDLRRNAIALNTLRAAGFKTVFPYGTECPELMPVYLADRLRKHAPEPHPDLDVARRIRRADAQRFLDEHPGIAADTNEDLTLIENESWRETMLAFRAEDAAPAFAFADHGIELFSLTPQRLRTLAGERFPVRKEETFVNTVVRPTLFRSLQPL